MEAISHAGTVLGILAKDGVVLAAEKKVTSKLLEQHKSSEKVFQLSGNVIAGVAGLTADANSLVNYGRNAAQKYLLSYDDDIPVEQLVQRLCDMKQGYTQFGGLRPFGVSLLYAGYDPHHEFQLYQSDPSGNYSGWKAVCIGMNNGTATSLLKQDYKDDMTVQDALGLAARVLSKTMDTTSMEGDKRTWHGFSDSSGIRRPHARCADREARLAYPERCRDRPCSEAAKTGQDRRVGRRHDRGCIAWYFFHIAIDILITGESPVGGGVRDRAGFVLVGQQERIHTAHDRRTSTSRADTATLHGVGADALEHRRLLEHVRHNHESNHVAPHVYTVEMTLLAVAPGDGNFLHRDVEVVLGCVSSTKIHTIKEAAAVARAPLELNRDNVPHRLMEQLHRDAHRSHGDR